MIVYKVVRRTREDRYFSAIVGHSLGRHFRAEFQAEYKLGVKTRPPVPRSCLMAFRNLKAARKFAGDTRRADLKILKCEAKVSKRKLPHHLPGILDFLTAKRFWWNPHPVREWWDVTIPDGTVFCTRITPIEVVPT